MTLAAPTAKKRLTIWEVPSLFASSVADFKKVADFARSFFESIGYLLGTLSGLQPIIGALKTVSNYISSTKTITNATTWVDRDEKGRLKILTKCGNPALKVYSTVGFQIVDGISTLNFLEKLKVINLSSISQTLGKVPVFGIAVRIGLTNIKNFFGITAGLAAIADTGIMVYRLLSSLYQKGLAIDLVSGFKGKGWLRTVRETEQTEKHKKEAIKEIRSFFIDFWINAFKITLTALAIFGVIVHPAVAFVGLALGIVGITKMILKAYEKKLDPTDPNVVQAWQKAEALPT